MYSKFSEKLGPNPSDLKIALNEPKTNRKGVGKGSRGIGQPVASSSSNMSPWGLMATPFEPIFLKFSVIFCHQGLWEALGISRGSLWGTLGDSGGSLAGSLGASLGGSLVEVGLQGGRGDQGGRMCQNYCVPLYFLARPAFSPRQFEGDPHQVL